MKTRFTFLFCFLLNFLFYDSGAQETTTVTGGNLTGAGGSVSLSLAR